MYDIEDHIIPETPKLMSALPIKWPQEVVVRVYVIRVSCRQLCVCVNIGLSYTRDLISQHGILEER